jgi:hypothetical protein
VASKEKQNSKIEGTGFAGLSSMVSNVDSTLANVAKKTQTTATNKPSPQPSRTDHSMQEERSEPAPNTYQQPTRPSGDSSTGKWLIGIAIVIGFFWLASESGNNNPSGSSASGRPPSNSTVAPAPNRPQPTVQQQLSSAPTEERPNVGRNNVLTIPQIRYCLAEKIRIDASESHIDRYNQAEVNRFNRYITDYNSRCGEYRYRQGALARARDDIEPFRAELQNDGRSRFARATAGSSTAQGSVRPTPDPIVKAVQQRLNELGYGAGPADGLYGPRTRNAISSFQRDNRLHIDGTADVVLLQQLRNAR